MMGDSERKSVVHPDLNDISDVDNMDWSYENATRLQELRDEQNFERREVMFRRVLASIQSEDGSRTEDVDIEEDVKAAIRDRKLKQEKDKEQKEKRLTEQKEKLYFEAQRNALRTRYEKGSADSEGIDPLAETKAHVPDDHIDSIPEIRNFSINDLLDNPAFDSILETIEQDLELIAVDKDSNNPTELGEVLRYLDLVAQSRPSFYPSTGSGIIHSRTNHDVYSDEALDQELQYKEAPEESIPVRDTTEQNLGSQQSKVDFINNSQQHESITKYPDSSNGRVGGGKVQARNGGRGGRGGSASTASVTSVPPDSAVRDADNSQVNDGYSDEEDEEWRHSRSKLKSTSTASTGIVSNTIIPPSNVFGSWTSQLAINTIKKKDPVMNLMKSDTISRNIATNEEQVNDDVTADEIKQDGELGSIDVLEEEGKEVDEEDKLDDEYSDLPPPVIVALTANSQCDNSLVDNLSVSDVPPPPPASAPISKSADSPPPLNDSSAPTSAAEDDRGSCALSGSATGSLGTSGGALSGFSRSAVGGRRQLQQSMADARKRLASKISSSTSSIQLPVPPVLDKTSVSQSLAIDTAITSSPTDTSRTLSISSPAVNVTEKPKPYVIGDVTDWLAISSTEDCSPVLPSSLQPPQSPELLKCLCLLRFDMGCGRSSCESLQNISYHTKTDASAVRGSSSDNTINSFSSDSSASPLVDYTEAIGLLLDWLRTMLHQLGTGCAIATVVLERQFSQESPKGSVHSDPLSDEMSLSHGPTLNILLKFSTKQTIRSQFNSSSSFNATTSNTTSMSILSGLDKLLDEISNINMLSTKPPILSYTQKTCATRLIDLLRLYNKFPGNETINRLSLLHGCSESEIDNEKFTNCLTSFWSPNTSLSFGAEDWTGDLHVWQDLANGRAVSVVLKNYVFETNYTDFATNTTSSSGSTSAVNELLISNLLTICTEKGLRLVGLRTAYPAESVRGHLHPDIKKYFTKHSNAGYVLVGSDSLIQKPLFVATFVSCTDVAASSLLREALGPEDPILAKRTDPGSVRALLGRDRDFNVTFPHAVSTANVSKEFALWNGPYKRDITRRKEDGVSVTSPTKTQAVSRILYPESRLISVGLVIRLSDVALANNVTVSMSSGQRQCWELLRYLHTNGFYFKALHTCQENDMLKLLQKPLGIPFDTRSTTTAGSNTLSQSNTTATWACLAVLSSTAGNILITKTKQYLLKHAAALTCLDYEVKVHFEVSSWEDMDSLQDQLSTSTMSMHSYSEVDLRREVLGSVPDEDYRSHEDVGVADVAVIVFSVPRILEDEYLVPSRCKLHPLLVVLSQLPTSANTTILGVRWCPSTLLTNHTQLVLCIRGFQLLENIITAMQSTIQTCELYSLTSTGSPSGRTSTGSSSDTSTSQFKSTITNHRNIEYNYKIHMGKNALDMVLTYFHSLSKVIYKQDLPVTLYWKLADADLQNSLPTWVREEQEYDMEPSSPSKSLTMQICRSFYPPGSFTTVSILFISWITIKDNRALTRIIRRLKIGEEDGSGCSILSIKSVTMTHDIVETLIHDQEREYHNVYEEAERQTWQSNCLSIIGSSYLAVVVEGIGLLRRLVGSIGPSCESLALRSNPRSVVAAIAQASTNSVSSTCQRIVPSILCSFTCPSTEALVQSLFSISVQELRARPVLLNSHVTHKVPDDNLSRFVTEMKRESDILLGIDPSNGGTLNGHTGSASVAGGGADSPTKNVLLAVDRICFVATGALLQTVGIGTVFELFDRVELQVVNARSCLLSSSAAKTLHDLAGQSSLSMKPPLQLLLAAPVLLLALEGSVLSINRLKGLTTADRDGGRPRTGANSIWTLEGGHWGALASSSPRLAKGLLLRCFPEYAIGTSPITSTAYVTDFESLD